MTDKILFIDYYLEELDDCNEIQKIIDKNKSYPVEYSTKNDGFLKNYDNIIANINELNETLKKKTFVKYKEQLYYIGDYNEYNKLCKKFNELYDIRSGVKISYKVKNFTK